MGFMLRQFILAVVALSSCEGFLRSYQHQRRRSDIVFVTSLNTGDVRHKRSVDMPDNLRFRFVTAGMDLEVRVRRTVKDKPEVTSFPLFVIENGTITRRYLSPLQTAAIYSNDSQGHMFIVRRPLDRAEFILEGVLWDGLQQYHIMPDHDALHRMYKLERVVDFRGDYIENTASRSKDAPSRQTRLRRGAEQSKHDISPGPANRSVGRPRRGDWVNRWMERRDATFKRRRLKTRKSQMKEKDRKETAVEEDDKQHLANSVDGQKAKRRRKRQLTTDYEIEIFLVADFRDYSGWLNYYGGNTTRTEIEMNLYYALVANSISQRYRSISHVDPNLNIGIIITGLLIVNSRDDSYWTENHVLRPGSPYVEANDALESFRTWVRNARANLPPSDHWMLFTGYDIYSDKNPNIAGLAKLAGLCSYLSVSIVEQDNTASVGATAAHELGHSLSARHDGEEKDCRDEDNFIMSRKLKTPDVEKLASRPWQFSPCSVRAFREFLSQVKCGQRGPARGSALATELGGGQVFSADLQCQLALGRRSYFGRSLQSAESYSSMCRRLYCAVPGEPGLFQAIFAMEKTTCGDGKWCIQGKCSADVQAPRVTDTCPQGDDPAAPCAEEDCQYYTQRTRDIYCCYTCRNPVTKQIILSPSNVPILLAQRERNLPALATSSNVSAVPSNQSSYVTVTPPQASTDVSFSTNSTDSFNSPGVPTDFSSLNSTSSTSSASSSTSTPAEDVSSIHNTPSIPRPFAMSGTESTAAAASAQTYQSAATTTPATLSGSGAFSNLPGSKTSPETSSNPVVQGTTVGYISDMTQTSSYLGTHTVQKIPSAGLGAGERDGSRTSTPPPPPLDFAPVADSASVTLPSKGEPRYLLMPLTTAHTPDSQLSHPSNSLNSTVTSDQPQVLLNELHAKVSLGKKQPGRAPRVLDLPFTEGGHNTSDSAASLHTTHSPVAPTATRLTTNKQTTYSASERRVPSIHADTGTHTVYLITTEPHTTHSAVDPKQPHQPMDKQVAQPDDQPTTQSASDFHIEHPAVSSHTTYSSTAKYTVQSASSPRLAYKVISLPLSYLPNEGPVIDFRTKPLATAIAIPLDSQNFHGLLEVATQIAEDPPGTSQPSDTSTPLPTATTPPGVAGVSPSVSPNVLHRVSSTTHRLLWPSKGAAYALGNVSTVTQPVTSAPLYDTVRPTQPPSQAPINETDPLRKRLSPNRAVTDDNRQLHGDHTTSRAESRGMLGQRDAVLATTASGVRVKHLPEADTTAAATEDVSSEPRVEQVWTTSSRARANGVTPPSRELPGEATAGGLPSTERVAEASANTKQPPVLAASMVKIDWLLMHRSRFSSSNGGADVSVSFSLGNDVRTPEAGTAQARGHFTSGLPLAAETARSVTESRTFTTNKLQGPQATSAQLLHTSDM